MRAKKKDLNRPNPETKVKAGALAVIGSTVMNSLSVPVSEPNPKDDSHHEPHKSHAESGKTTDRPTDNSSHPRSVSFLDRMRDIISRLFSGKKVWIAACFVVVLLAGGVFGFIYFGKHLLPNTRLAGQSISMSSRSDLEKRLNQRVAEINAEVHLKDKTLSPTLEEIGLSFNVPGTVDHIFSVHKSSWVNRLKFWGNKDHEIVYSIDQAKLDAYFTGIKQSVDQPSQDATITMDGDKAVIQPEVIAKVSGFPSATDDIKKSASSLTDIKLDVQIYEDPPLIVSADLEQSKKSIDEIIATPVSLVLQGNVLQPSSKQIAGWLNLSQNKQTKTVDVTIDDLKVSAYFDGAIKPFIKPPRSRIVVQNPDGTERELNPGEDGVDIADKQKVISTITSQLYTHKPVRQELSVEFAKRSTIKAGDYDKWLEADLTNKRLYAYEKDRLVATFLSSAGAPETPTVVGEFKIQSKVRKQTMRGLNTDGSSYNVPNVEFVSYFYKDYAIHGNYWRPASVFGNQNTSHGCVGLVNADASWVYDWAAVGTPIITHY